MGASLVCKLQLVLCLTLAWWILMPSAEGQSETRVVEAERFVIRNSNGKEMAWLGSNAGGTELRINGKTGKAGVTLRVDASGSKMLLRDSVGRLRFTVKAIESPLEEGPSVLLTIADRAGRARASLALMGDDEQPWLVFFDHQERVRLELELTEDDTGSISILEQSGRVQWAPSK